MIKVFFIASIMAFSISAHAAQDNAPMHITRPIVGCQSSAVFDKIATISAEGDTGTAEKLLTAAFDLGQCVELAKGEPVYIEGMTADFRLTKVRPKGQVMSYWTGTKFIGP